MGFESSSKKIRCLQISLFIPFISSIFQPMAALYFETTEINFPSCSSESNDEMIMGLEFPSSKKMYFNVSGRGFSSNSAEFSVINSVSRSTSSLSLIANTSSTCNKFHGLMQGLVGN